MSAGASKNDTMLSTRGERRCGTRSLDFDLFPAGGDRPLHDVRGALADGENADAPEEDRTAAAVARARHRRRRRAMGAWLLASA